MKRIRCPKCDEHIQFDETQYATGCVLVFTCPSCQKQFRLRIGKKEVDVKAKPLAMLTILENDFQERQEIQLFEGVNLIGKKLRANAPPTSFLTVDPSIDPVHCRMTAHAGDNGKVVVSLSDGPSNTGTFLNGQILSQRDNVAVEDGAVINIGAATIILSV